MPAAIDITGQRFGRLVARHIAREFGVCESLIRMIETGKRWKHIQQPTKGINLC